MTKSGNGQRGFAPGLALLVTAAAMTWWTWNSWTDLFVDSGRELYLAWQVSEGRALYIDVASFNGPLSPYVNALWLRLFGVGVRALVIGNLTLLLLFLGVLYSTLRLVASRLTATVAAMVFVLMFAFGEYGDVANFNYLTPYSHELVHGLFLSFLAIRALAWSAQGKRRSGLVVTGLALGAAALTKPEVAVAAFVACGAGAMGLWRDETRRHGRGLDVAAGGAALLLPPLVAWMILSLTRSGSEAALATFGSFIHVFTGEVTNLPFYRHMSGIDAPAASLSAVGLSLLVYAGVALVATTAGFAAGRSPRRAEIGAAAGGALFLGGVVFAQNVLAGIGRALPAIMLLVMAWLAWTRFSLRSDPLQRQRLGVRFMLVLFAFLVLGKMLLNARLSQYGFVLAMPAALLVVVILADWLPESLESHGADAGVVRNVVWCAVATVVLIHLVVHKQRLDRQTTTVAMGHDRLRADSRGVPMNAMLAIVQARLAPGDRLTVLPEGALVNVLSRHRSSSPFVAFLPPETAIFGEARLSEAMQRDPPEYAILVDRPYEYGMSGFGHDYLQTLAAWVNEHFETVAEVPGTRDDAPSFGMRLMRRRGLP